MPLTTMKPPFRVFANFLFASSVAIGAIPVAVLSADSALGLASMIVVPTFFIAITFTLISRKPDRRLWWFAFSCSTAAWMLFLSQLFESAVNGMALYLQDLSQSGAISFSQRIVEPMSLALIFLGPPIGAVLTGVGIARWSVLRFHSSPPPSERPRQWHFSAREMLIAVTAMSLMLALVFGRTRARHASEAVTKNAFLERFETSFETKSVALMQQPVISGGHRALIPESGFMSFNPPGVNEYRVTAPIVKDGAEIWAVWSYTCNGKHDDMVYQFAYSEAATENQLPSHPFPVKAYVNATWTLADGIPR